MHEVAEAVGVHETSVFRAIHGRRVATPQGVFPLAFFFSPGFQTGDGRSLSSRAVHSMIRRLIKEEDPYHPYSDMALAQILQARTIPIARRTIAKYRKQLHIPSTYDWRKRAAA